MSKPFAFLTRHWNIPMSSKLKFLTIKSPLVVIWKTKTFLCLFFALKVVTYMVLFRLQVYWHLIGCCPIGFMGTCSPASQQCIHANHLHVSLHELVDDGLLVLGPNSKSVVMLATLGFFITDDVYLSSYCCFGVPIRRNTLIQARIFFIKTFQRDLGLSLCKGSDNVGRICSKSSIFVRFFMFSILRVDDEHSLP